MAIEATKIPLSDQEDFYNKIHQHTWVRRTSGFLGGATMGAVYGAVIGAVAAFLPTIFVAIGLASAAAAAPALTLLAPSIALFAAIGSGLGMAIGADVAANAGSNAAASLAEQVGNENTLTGKAPAKANGMYVWKAAAVLVPLFAVAGALMATTPVTASVALAGVQPVQQLRLLHLPVYLGCLGH